jgi:nucleoside-diphosphate-sugar epimerase
MRVVVIGGTRFLGPHVVRGLVALDHEVTVVHRGQTETDLPESVQHLHGDRDRLPDLTDQFRAIAPEVALNMIPFGAADTQAFLAAFRGIARRVVGISSQDVYRAYGRLWQREFGPPDPIPLTEDAPLREQLYPLRDVFPGGDTYDKILAEQAILGDHALPGTILRLPMVYGRLDGHRIFSHLKRMDDGRPSILLDEGLARWQWSRGYVEDVATAIVRAVVDERAAGQVYNVAEPDGLTEADWVRRIGQAVGWTGEVVAVPSGRRPEKYPLDYRHHLVVDTTRIRRELGYRERVDPAEALRRTIAWERESPPTEIDPADYDYAGEDEILAELGAAGHFACST